MSESRAPEEHLLILSIILSGKMGGLAKIEDN
jgi:hypothetical protein